VADETGDAVERSRGEVGGVDLDHRVGDLAAVDGHDSRPEIPSSRRSEPLAAVSLEGDCDVGIRQRVAGDDPLDVVALGRGPFEVLPAGRDVVEEVVDGDGRPLGAAGGADRLDGAARDDEFRPPVAPARFRRDRQPGDGADGVQRLAAEPQRGDAGLQVVDVADLARRMFLDGAADRRPVHSDAVVAHPDPVDPAVLDLDADARGVGVERVLDEFLRRARGTLDHFAGGDPLDGGGVEFADLRRVAHSSPSVASARSSAATPAPTSRSSAPAGGSQSQSSCSSLRRTLRCSV